GRVMVSDFGVALRAADVTLTADGAVIGTPPFMSPEQCAGQRAGPQSDQYSIGIVAFQMLTGSVPFQADTLAGMMHHHFFTPAPDIRLVRDDVPTALVDVLHVALAKEPGARFPSTRDMLAAIDAIPFSEADRRESERILRKLAQGDPIARIATRSLPALPDSPTVALGAVTPPRLRLRSRRGARIAGAAAGVLLAVGAVWWTSQTSGTAPRPQAADSAPAPVAVESQPRVTPAIAPPSPTGKLRILTNPPDAVISIDGRHVGVGSAFDVVVAAGPRRLRIRAPGYETFDTTIVVQVGETHRLGRITLRGRDAGGGA
ncbi:MAG TPA: PEGA domain-containing protein, partial [Gemmatimonadales bacterium]|nr:PEGA domain-containing protein [Gemmatimonadales bacterium]